MGTYRPDLHTTNATIETMLHRHSVRSYSDKPVSSDDLTAVLSAAQATPTSSNQMSWSAVIVRDPERKRAIQELTRGNEFINNAPLFVVWVADLSRAGRQADRHGMPSEVFDYQEAILLGAIDATLAAQNATVAAESLGLGTCYVGGVRSAMAAIAALLDLPRYSFPVVGMAIGWPDASDTAGTKPRLPLSSFVFEERYDPEASDAGIAALDHDSAEYNLSQGRPPRRWSDASHRKWASADAIAGRTGNRDLLGLWGLADQ